MNVFRISESELTSSVGKIEYLKNGKATPSATLSLTDTLKIMVSIPRALGAVGASLMLFCGYDDSLLDSFTLKFEDTYSDFDIYTASLKSEKYGAGLLFAALSVSTMLGAASAYLSGERLIFKLTSEPIRSIQITVSDFENNPPDSFLGGVIYHIFVDRFARSGKTPQKKGAEYTHSWDAEIPEYPAYPGAPLKNKYLYGGDLRGIKEKLSYLSSLGVSLIYLSPIFESPSNHKYDTADYMRVDSAFGTEADLSELIAAAKEHGIGIILDGVFNHTGADSIYFNKYSTYDSLGAFQSKESPYYDWFDFQSYPDEYTSWWGIEILPRINPDKPALRAYLSGEGGVIDKYSKMGVVGFRLDVADELSDGFIASIKHRMSASRPENILYGEVWEDASNKIAYGTRKKYYIGSELDGVMNYTLRRGLISYLRDKSVGELAYAITDVMFNAPERIRHAQMNLLGSHDTVRALTALAGELPDGKENSYLAEKKMTDKERKVAVRRYVAAYTALATLPGIPSIFYGDEVGMEGYSDPFNRLTYPWGREDNELLFAIKAVNVARRENSVYRCGEYKLLYLDASLLIFARYENQDAYITVLNNSQCEKSVTLSRAATDILADTCAFTHTLKGESAVILKTKKNTTIQF